MAACDVVHAGIDVMDGLVGVGVALKLSRSRCRRLSHRRLKKLVQQHFDSLFGPVTVSFVQGPGVEGCSVTAVIRLGAEPSSTGAGGCVHAV